jgi:choline dehydrogenase-like flavoprotein
MTAKVFDAIVVGTGAGGGTAMKLLCEAGLSVCALNSGPRTDPSKDYRLHRQPYDLKYRGFGNPRRFEGKAHQEPYSVEESEYSEGRDLFEHDIAYSNSPGTDWYWKRCKATGGKANFWGRSSARFSDIDFKAADLDGFGENWPVDYTEIAPWFTKAERYMGVASTIQNRPSNPDGEYLPSMPWRCIDFIIQKGAEKIGVPYLPDRCAQLTKAHNGHPACHYCGNCSRGCDVGAFFSPTWFTIPEAEATKNLTLLTNALVRTVLVEENGTAKGVAYVDRETKREIEVYAKVVVLAASCVETAHIMLNSKSRHWPTGIANSSGELGRNLCDHLYGCPGYGYVPQLLGQPPFPDNIPVKRNLSAVIPFTSAAAAENFPATTASSKGSGPNTNATSSATTPRSSAPTSRRHACPARQTMSTSIPTRVTSSESRSFASTIAGVKMNY